LKNTFLEMRENQAKNRYVKNLHTKLFIL
jgi:hypothetical protein